MSLILVVDDEPTLVATLTFNLEREGYEVITASDGGQALEAVRESSPDLVILDLMLGEMHGFEVCRTLRRAKCSSVANRWEPLRVPRKPSVGSHSSASITNCSVTAPSDWIRGSSGARLRASVA
jgi:CheY-like chemotaxis protein